MTESSDGQLSGFFDDQTGREACGAESPESAPQDELLGADEVTRVPGVQSELSGTGECLTETNVFLPAIEMPLLCNPEDAEVIELEIADVEDDPENGRGSLAGTVASVILHVWLLMNLAQMTIEQQPYYYEPPIDSQMVENQSEEEEIEVVAVRGIVDIARGGIAGDIGGRGIAIAIAVRIQVPGTGIRRVVLVDVPIAVVVDSITGLGRTGEDRAVRVIAVLIHGIAIPIIVNEDIPLEVIQDAPG